MKSTPYAIMGRKTMNKFKSLCLLSFIALTAISSRGATFLVSSAADLVSTGTLRWAIEAANSNPSSPHTINFAIQGAPPHIITISNSLPYITNKNVLIDATTQSGYTGAPVVRVSITSAFSITAFTLNGDGSGVQGLAIDGNLGGSTVAIIINGISNRVSSCVIRSNVYGITTMSNRQGYAMIGGSSPTNRNYISRNQYDGVRLFGGTGGFNRVLGNVITTNGGYGISLWFGDKNTIGGTNTAERNIISGNIDGLNVTSGSSGNLIAGNYVGLDESGTNRLGNSNYGMIIDSAGNTIEANIVSGNPSIGIWLSSWLAVSNVIRGNVVGLTSTSNRIGSGTGIRVHGSGNTIYQNVISGNDGYGVYMTGTNARNNLLVQNIIGLDPSGTSIRSNTLSGVFLVDGASSNQVGAFLYGAEPNVITGNGGAGVGLQSYFSFVPCEGNIIANNFIGLDKTGTNAIGNYFGVYADVGKGTVVYGNYITGNKYNGMYILGTNNTGMIIQENIIGMDYSRLLALGNAQNGIYMDSVRDARITGNTIVASTNHGVRLVDMGDNVLIENNLIGVNTNGVAMGNQHGISFSSKGFNLSIVSNVVSGNRGDGINFNGYGVASNAVIRGNMIGVNASGTAAVPNAGTGINVSSFDHLVIGGTNSADQNTISGNGFSGIDVFYSTGTLVSIVGNKIGLDAAGQHIISNANSGVRLIYSRDVSVGGDVPNYIAGNDHGVSITASDSCRVTNNVIGVVVIQSGVTNKLGNRGSGIVIATGCKSNRVENNIVAVNQQYGIYIESEAAGTVVRGNRIGIGTLGFMQNRGNGGAGIYGYFPSNAVIGGYSAADANRIAFNGGPGIAMVNLGGLGQGPFEVLGNLIYSNAGLAIDLSLDGVTPNNPAPDTDGSGMPNQYQNFPELRAGIRGGTNTQVFGQLVSSPSKVYRVELFGTDPVAGMKFLGATNVALPATGTGSFYFASSSSLVSGAVVYATATTTNGTSEFSSSLLPGEEIDPDNDMMPSWWESAYGLNPAVSNSPGSDADQDGYSDLEEWIAFTLPQDEQSYPQITQITKSAKVAVTFPSASRIYQLEQSDNLYPPLNWYASGVAITGFYGYLTVVVTNNSSISAYRIRASMP
jgi:parallel beta-helix repeat protein